MMISLLWQCPGQPVLLKTEKLITTIRSLIRTTSEKFEDAALGLWLGLTSTPIGQETRAFRKRSSNWKNLKT